MSSEEANIQDASSYEGLLQKVFVYGGVSLTLAMSKETGMVECLCSALGPLSSADIAGQLRLKERYVREVLNSLTAAGLVQLEEGSGGKDGREGRYWVPPTLRPPLSRFGALSMTVSSCAQRYSGMRKCFDLDGPNGIRYESTSFKAMDDIALMLLESTTRAILQTPGLRQRLESGIDALEVGCGTGRLFLHFASMFPKSRFILTDLTPRPMEQAQELARERRLQNVSFRTLDVLDLPDELNDSVDWVASAEVIHDLPYPLRALQGLHRILKPGGHLSVVDRFVSSFVAENVNSDESAVLYAVSTFKCVPESYQQPDSDALGACWGEEKARQLVRKAGFTVLGLARSEGFCSLDVCMCRKNS